MLVQQIGGHSNLPDGTWQDVPGAWTIVHSENAAVVADGIMAVQEFLPTALPLSPPLEFDFWVQDRSAAEAQGAAVGSPSLLRPFDDVRNKPRPPVPSNSTTITVSSSLLSNTSGVVDRNKSFCEICDSRDEELRLICCDACPCSVCLPCINRTRAPSGTFFCSQCVPNRSAQLVSTAYAGVRTFHAVIPGSEKIVSAVAVLFAVLV